VPSVTHALLAVGTYRLRQQTQRSQIGLFNLRACCWTEYSTVQSTASSLNCFSTN